MNEQHDLVKISRQIRRLVIDIAYKAKTGHIGSALSICELLAVIYFHAMKSPVDPLDAQRDRFILSKGHGAAAFYAALHLKGLITEEQLNTYLGNGSVLAAHPMSKGIEGVDFATGSLGHGLPVAVGMAHASRLDNNSFRVFAILSDGECQEGSTWEAALRAGHHKLNNLVVFVDYNRWQAFGRIADVGTLEPFSEKWKSFGFKVHEVDGHNPEALASAYDQTVDATQPTVIICSTMLGKGISFMEDKLEWHYRFMNSEQYEQAVHELNTNL